MTPAAAPGDTIVAIATAPGAGAVGMIRLSGPASVAIVAPLIRLRSPGGLENVPPRILHRAEVVDPRTGDVLDIGLAVRMVSPFSYTGEDVVELFCHGNPVLLSSVVTLLTASGARLAEPGEFTRRAFVNGRLNLIQAEAVAELISARTERAVRLATKQLGGGLSDELTALREGLLDLVAGLEVALDFPEDEVGVSRSDAAKRLRELSAAARRLAENAARGRAVQQGLSVMLAGAPNVGKSCLFNKILGSDRVIVDGTPGTTRDIVDSEVLIGGVQVRLRDGAGLGLPRDPVDAEGMRRTRSALAESDLVLAVLDASRPMSAADFEVLELTLDRDRIVVANKIDLGEPRAFVGTKVDLVCSALTGAGLADLGAKLTRWVEARTSLDGDEGGVVASVRAGGALTEAVRALSMATEAAESGTAIEAVLVDLRSSMGSIDQALGLNVEDAVLDRVFSTFCVGK